MWKKKPPFKQRVTFVSVKVNTIFSLSTNTINIRFFHTYVLYTSSCHKLPYVLLEYNLSLCTHCLYDNERWQLLMDPGHDVDSKPVYHLSPETEGVVVNHFLCSAWTPVLEHSARPRSDKRRNICISTGQQSRPFHSYELYSYITVWTQLCDPRGWGNVDETCGLIRGRNTLLPPMGNTVCCVVVRKHVLHEPCGKQWHGAARESMYLILLVTWTMSVESGGVFWPPHPWDCIPLGVAKFIPWL